MDHIVLCGIFQMSIFNRQFLSNPQKYIEYIGYIEYIESKIAICYIERGVLEKIST